MAEQAQIDGADHSKPLQAAIAYRTAGLSFIPIRLDGSKAPESRLLPDEQDPDTGHFHSTWDPFKTRLPTEAEVRNWFDRQPAPGLGIICGRVSGGLETIDFDADAKDVFPQWCALVEAEAPGLLEKLSVSSTPKPGFHVRYRCREIAIPGNLKLAMNGKLKLVLIETRGEGGYAIAPGSPKECHATGRPYVHVAGPKISQLETITEAEREIMLRCARSFDRPAESPQSHGRSSNGHAGWDVSPGDDFSERGPDWAEILGEGWECVRQLGGKRYWRRPGKTGNGCSATTGYCTNDKGHDLLAVFSTNAHPFPGPENGRQCSIHTKFGAFALLDHHGDFKAAAKALADQGYGKKSEWATSRAADRDTAQPAPGVDLGDLRLEVSGVRETEGGKIIAMMVVLRDGKPVDRVQITSAVAGRRDAVRFVARHLDMVANHKIDLAIGQLLTMAADLAQKQAPRDGKRIKDIVAEITRADLQPAYRTAVGIYAEARGAEVRRQDFVAHTPSPLIDAAADAVDAPRTRYGFVNRVALLRAIKTELEILFSDLTNSLPFAPGAMLAADSAAAKDFHNAMARVLTTIQPCEARQDGRYTRASLVSRAAEKIASSRGPSNGWSRVLDGFNCWWRVYHSPEGEVIRLLAVRWELAHQMRAQFPGVNDQNSLNTLGRQYGLIDAKPPVPAKGSHGKERLAVLARAFTDELLDMAGELKDEPDDP